MVNVVCFVVLDEDRSRERDSRSSGRNTPSRRAARESRSLESAAGFSNSAENLGTAQLWK